MSKNAGVHGGLFEIETSGGPERQPDEKVQVMVARLYQNMECANDIKY